MKQKLERNIAMTFRVTEKERDKQVYLYSTYGRARIFLTLFFFAKDLNPI